MLRRAEEHTSSKGTLICDENSKRQLRRGVVLEGGGGKGAYAVGCLQAFAERGIQFDAIAATSVGALNGALLAAGRLEGGVAFWERLRPRDVYALKHMFVVRLAVQFLHGLSLYSSKDIRVSIRSRVKYVGTFWIMALLAAVANCIKLQLNPFRHGDWLTMLTGYLVVGALIVTVTTLIPPFLRKAGFTLFSTGPLRRSIEDTLGQSKFLVPTFITVGKTQHILDPDRPVAIDNPLSLMRRSYKFAPTEIVVPIYQELESASPAERTDWLMASSALPFGIFPDVDLPGGPYVDGGLVDNTPIYPLVSIRECDEVIVIHLNPKESSSEEMDAWLLEHWQRVDRTIRLASMSMEETLAIRSRKYGDVVGEKGWRGGMFGPKTSDPPLGLRFREPSFWPERFVHVMPNRSLGGLLTGTLNFSSRKAKRLLDEGYRDAMDVIRREWPEYA